MHHTHGTGPHRQPDSPSREEVRDRESVLHRAALLARRGRGFEALRELEQADQPEFKENPRYWDLMARINAQLGCYLEAESCWRRALHLDETNPDYTSALARLQKARRPVLDRLLPAFFISGVFVIAVLLQGARLSGSFAEQMDTTQDRIGSLAQRQEELLEQTAGRLDTLEVLSHGHSQKLSALGGKVSGLYSAQEDLGLLQKRISQMEDTQGMLLTGLRQETDHLRKENTEILGFLRTLADTPDQVESIRTRLAELGKNLGRLEQQISRNRMEGQERLNQYEIRIKSVQESLATLGLLPARLEQFQADLLAVQASIQEVSSTARLAHSAVAERLDGIRASVANLASANRDTEQAPLQAPLEADRKALAPPEALHADSVGDVTGNVPFP